MVFSYVSTIRAANIAKEGLRMTKVKKEQIQRHIKTHTLRSDDDRNAIALLNTFLRSDGKIAHNGFSCNDTYPNIDGNFELIPNPIISRRPKQNFSVQIKGTSIERVNAEGIFKYQLQSLAFPAYIADSVTSDPGILFVVLNAGKRGQERVFWKYMSPKFIASIDFDKDSKVIDFTFEDEIMNTDESVNEFVKKLDNIADTHSYMNQMETKEYERSDIERLIINRCENISEAIETGNLLNQTRDKISRKILTELNDLCRGTLILNALRYFASTNLRVAWEISLSNIETKFLATFLQGLRYIGLRVPEDGQYERLMLKYYNFLWKIRDYLQKTFGIIVLNNLEDFPLKINKEDEEYNQLLASAIEKVVNTRNPIKYNRYYILKKNTFYVGRERYFEITLQLADKYATKYNRVTVYSQKDVSTNYSIQIGCAETDILLWDNLSKIRVVTDWRVSIEPASLNKLAKILRCNQKVGGKYGEYVSLMDFLTNTGINLLDFADMGNDKFHYFLQEIYRDTNTSNYKDVLLKLHQQFGQNTNTFGNHVIRYAIIHMREDLLEDLIPEDSDDALNSMDVYLSKSCYPFIRNPILYNLPNKKTNVKTVSSDVLRAIGSKQISEFLPYIRMKYLIDSTGELYFPKEDVENLELGQTIKTYNNKITNYDKSQGCELKEIDNYVYLDEYVNNTTNILNRLLEVAKEGNVGQSEANHNFISQINTENIDDTKIKALTNAFVDSKVLMIYGAAGTGKTTLMDYISTMLDGCSKLFLTKTHTALENMKRRIKSPGFICEFMGIDSFNNSYAAADYDVIFIDECSTIDNRTMVKLLEKSGKESLLVLAGDIYQIESIDFGNWFFYAKEILPEKSIVELDNTWRTQEPTIKNLWEEVRFLQPIITEKLVIDGPFSKDIGKDIFDDRIEDEVVLCLNYDGKFGLNSINNYFQDANPSQKAYYWYEWKYKIGDPILFNENKRFPMLYNNLKGIITDIKEEINGLKFTIDIPIILTAVNVRGTDLEIISHTEKTTRISFSVCINDDNQTEEDYDEARMKSIIPFQLAYAVSIHKAQGLEYTSVKIVIPQSNSERITHGVFYTAITRTKKKLKIYWSANTMEDVISGFNEEKQSRISLDFIKGLISNN